jgi:MFS family permease
VCQGDTVLSYQIDYSDIFTLKNWLVDLDLICTPKLYIGYIGALYSTGTCVACFCLSVIADKYGRLNVLQFTIAMFIPLLGLVAFTRSLACVYFFCFYLGFV